jgi:outer membrane protein OmpA-like peptidoglycan-associated protein
MLNRLIAPRRITTLFASAMLSASAALPAFAVDAETIVKALQPKPKAPLTRSFQNQPTRGIAIEGGTETAEAAPSIDLYIPFEYDQANLTMSDAILTLGALAKALQDPRLASMKFSIIGHTDARGGDDYNLQLSRRRADAVKSCYLNQFHKVELARLTAEGRGKRELKDPTRPEDGINRRVQIKSIQDGTS